MDSVETFDELRKVIDENNGLLTIEMQKLRDLGGHGRLGVHVRDAISKKLEGLGVAHYPKELPQYQHERVRLYIRGSAVSDLINAVLEVGEEQDQALRGAAAAEAENVLREVRALVCG